MNTIERLKEEAAKRGLIDISVKPPTDPIEYITKYLGLSITPQQEEVVLSLMRYKRVLVQAGHATGKDFIASALALWHYDTFKPGRTLIFAPSSNQIKDVFFAEVRKKYKGKDIYPIAPRIQDSADHYMVGVSARDDSAAQGRHDKNIFLLFDEACGIDDCFWEAGESMVIGPDHYWLCIFNPTTTDSKAYKEVKSGRWKVLTLSCLDHPNVVENKEIYPGAVQRSWVEDKINAWCEPNEDGDFEWEGKRYKTGPLFQSRALGIFPTSQTNSVWSEKDLQNLYIEKERTGNITIGVDIACIGGDSTAIVIKDGPVILDIIERNGLELSEIAGLVKSLLDNYSEEPKKVKVYYDSVGIGYGFKEFADGYNFIAVNNAEKADSEEYPNKRSEGWFTSKGNYIPDINLREELINQLRTPSYKLNSKGQLLVESKDITRKTLKRSPDLADAYCLACRKETSWFDKYGVLYK